MKQTLLLVFIAAVVSAAVVGFTSKMQSSKTSPEEMVQMEEMAQFKAWQEEQAKAPVISQSSKVVTTKAVQPKKVVYQSPKMDSESQNAAKTTEKKGWSKAAKGAVIGAASGAAIGAVVNKRNRAVGAVIGGVVGAGAGYGIGRSMDKKDGRS